MVRVHFGPPLKKVDMRYGDIAQLGERLPCKQEVSGSIPLISTMLLLGQLSNQCNVWKLKRRSSEARELLAGAGSERSGACDDEGP